MDIYLQAYESMLLLRRFEEVLTKHYLDEKVFSFVHFYTGSEASAVGVCMNLTKSDKVFGNHRSHGHYLAKGGCPAKLAAEMLGKATGCAKGFGGSMHPAARECGFLGTSPILGSSVPLGVGAAFAEKFNKTGNIVVSFTGDGASEEGLSIEAINLAAAWKLPHITVIENNNWSVDTPIRARRGEFRSNQSFYNGLGVNYYTVDGTSFTNVYSKMRTCVRELKENSMPIVLEIFTHRFLAHSTPLLNYRLRQHDTKEVMESEDCLNKMRKILDIDLSSIDAKVEQQVQNALAFAINSPEPEKSSLLQYIYASN